MTAVFPLGSTFLPGETVVLQVFEPRYRRMLDDLRSTGSDGFVTVLIERGSEVGGGDRRFARGVFVHVADVVDAGGVLVVRGTAGEPIEIIRWQDDDPYPRAETRPVGWATVTQAVARDCASALTLLAQSVRSLLARHGMSDAGTRHPHAAALATVASGHWFGTDVTLRELEKAYWAAARCVPCGPLDRHRLLCAGSAPDAVRELRSVVEHTDEILAFGMRDER